TPNVDEMGSDLLVMCAYAYHIFLDELLVISIGTATVVSHVTKDGVFKHCVIAPGIGKLAETLWGNAAKLPEFEINRTRSFLANTTIDAMNVGVYQGFVGMLRYILVGLRSELGTRPKVIACGGFGKLVIEDVREVEYYEPDMVTVGLNYIYNRYVKK
ncbi:MAG: type III pantothenate kinase, partial [Erysipelotrichaceae bacterium]|nr:type III pantothenate kinase [Erysipelotrichaceae bacterium]